MFVNLLTHLRHEISGYRAWDVMVEITRHHRIQASPGFRQAALALVPRLEGAGLRVELLSFPADGQHRYWTYCPGPEWQCEDAELTLLSPERRRLARWEEHRLSLIQRSAPTPPKGVECPLVLLSNPEDPASYRDADLQGKALMVDGDLQIIRRLAAPRGVIGLVTDGMRELPPVRRSGDLPDALQYTSFWWNAGEEPMWGFVLSPRAGQELRRLLRDAGPAGLPVHARVRSRFYPGSMDVLSALLPGSSPEEVMVVAHLCHPQPSANDNASGSAAAVEALISIATLISRGTLARPRRGIRLLLVPEINGTTCYLASHPEVLGRTVAAVNLDMVGERQDLCGSTLQVEAGPLATPSFASDLLALIMREALAEGSNWAGTAPLPALRWAETPFSGGSDHYLLGDPTVGIPCPMIIQWPDRFYHTSEDTPDKVDPGVLARVAAATAAYALFLAEAHLPQATWLAGEMVARFPALLHEAVKQVQAAPLEDRVREVIDFRLQRRLADLASLRKLLCAGEEQAWEAWLASLEEECRWVAQRELARTRALLPVAYPTRPTGDAGPPAPAAEADRLVPHRPLPGPVDLRDALAALSPDEALTFLLFRRQHKKQAGLVEPRLLYWSDGCRTLAEVERLVELETGVRDTPYALRYLKLLARAGFLELRVRN